MPHIILAEIPILDGASEETTVRVPHRLEVAAVLCTTPACVRQHTTTLPQVEGRYLVVRKCLHLWHLLGLHVNVLSNVRYLNRAE